jgi:hypothetical protein
MSHDKGSANERDPCTSHIAHRDHQCTCVPVSKWEIQLSDNDPFLALLKAATIDGQACQSDLLIWVMRDLHALGADPLIQAPRTTRNKLITVTDLLLRGDTVASILLLMRL